MTPRKHIQAQDRCNFSLWLSKSRMWHPQIWRTNCHRVRQVSMTAYSRVSILKTVISSRLLSKYMEKWFFVKRSWTGEMTQQAKVLTLQVQRPEYNLPNSHKVEEITDYKVALWAPLALYGIYSAPRSSTHTPHSHTKSQSTKPTKF